MGAYLRHTIRPRALTRVRAAPQEVPTLFKKDKPAALAGGKIDTVLGAGTSFNGTLKSDGNLRIDGSYQGHIETAGNLIVGAAAKVLADIKANSVQVWGAVRGDITAQGRLEILPGGRVWGDIEVAALLIDEGGVSIDKDEVQRARLPVALR